MTSKDDCICRDQPLTVLVGAWTTRTQPLIVAGVSNGRPVNRKLLQETVEMIRALSNGAERAFRPESYKYYHHLPGCPFDALGTKESLCQGA